MNDSIKKFEELLKSDPAVQEKLREASASYTGKSGDAKETFEKILLPVAKEYGIDATFEEFESYINALSENQKDLSPEELATVAGGKGTYGLALNFCIKFGLGIGGSGGGDEPTSVCVIFGGDSMAMCVGVGENLDTTE